MSSEKDKARAAKWYRDNHERALEYRRQWRKTHKQENMIYKNSWRSRNKDKALAHWAVSNALRDGRLVKQSCEVCGEDKVHAHHEDYSKQLEVSWLCDYHHKERHGVLINV